MKKILIPVDFSEHTWVTVEYGLDMAGVTGASILLFHSIFDQVMLAAGAFPDSIASQTVLDMSILQEIREEAERRMKDLEARAFEKSQGKIAIKSSIATGEPDIEILEAAKEYQPDLIIVGAVGQGQKNHFTGSTAEKLMKNALCPVLAIPINCGFSGLGKVIYAIDPDKLCEPCMVEAQHFLAPFSSEIHFLFIRLEEEHDALFSELKEKMKDISYLHLANCEKSKEEIYDSINRINPALIAFHFHRQSPFSGWFRPVLSRRDLYKAHLPLLAFPQKQL
ncbi:MAG: universal stress protein [Bacteroidales bacterium]